MGKVVGDLVPQVVFRTRVRDESIGGENPFRWQDLNTEDVFKGKRVVVFSLPGAFTPTCSNSQVPGFDEAYEDILGLGVDEVYCVSVNDAFAMYQWGKQLGVKNVKLLPDGNADFTDGMGMLVEKCNLGFGSRSWRYAMVVLNGKIEWLSEEEGRVDNCETDPYENTTPETVIEYLVSKLV